VYSATGFRAFQIGDIDVLWHDGLFHLFHLVLPNHDYIAHAVSEDGLTWRRIDNALFISNPGHFDDDMLWTMHVSPDPHREGRWRMFYTGLRIAEGGRVQRVGLAVSDDLYHWEKIRSADYPLEASGPYYEHSVDAGREWVSFRDPYFVRHDDRGYLLIAARINQGPLIRRGCVALAEEVEPGRFELGEPLFYPGRYDDVEVPGLFELDNRFYLIGSIREDRKVHYWYADDFHGPYRNFSDNVLMPQGDYAARICQARDSLLVWSFFFKDGDILGDHLLPPPKEIAVEDGHLRLRSYRGFDDTVTEELQPADLLPLESLLGNRNAHTKVDGDKCWIWTETGFDAFLLRGSHLDYRLSGTIHVERDGKFGLVMHLSEEGDGYFIAIDPVKGIAQIRYWAKRPGGTLDEAFDYRQLQESFHIAKPGPIPFQLISYGTYIELSLRGDVILTLADQRRVEGRVGFAVESAQLRLADLELETLYCPPYQPYESPDPGARLPLGSGD
jgi:beta-fructofuranosidase